MGFTAAVLLSMVVLFTPDSGVPTAPAGTDKVVHLLLFALLAVTGRIRGIPVVALLPALAVYAGVSEVLQAVLPIGRDGGVADALADVTGAVLGIAGYALATRRRAAEPREFDLPRRR